MKNIYERAKARFDEYAGFSPPVLPDNELSALQVELCRWQSREFGAVDPERCALGVNEELGELSDAISYLAMAQGGAGRMSHVLLKRLQRIRGFDDLEKTRAEVADAIGDTVIYLTQVATSFRLDFGTVVFETAKEVMHRKWRQDPERGVG